MGRYEIWRELHSNFERQAATLNPTEGVNVWVGIIVKEAHARYDTGEVTKVATVSTVPDGTSNTLLYLEKARDARDYSMVAEDADGNGFWEGGIARPSDWPCVRGFIRNPALTPDNQQRARSDAGLITFEPDFGGPHPGTTSAVLGDGSSHAINNSASGIVLYNAGTRAGGEITNINEL